MTNLYDILKIDKSATPTEIKQAYRKLAKVLHPDINKEPGAAEKFKIISEAYEVLSNEEARKDYDLQDRESSTMAESGIFSSQVVRHEKTKGTDIQKTVEVSLVEAIVGKKIDLQFMRQELCTDCNGTGGKEDTIVECVFCDSTGIVTEVTKNDYGFTAKTQFPCTVCAAERAEAKGNVCGTCEGVGYNSVAKSRPLQLPAGLFNGRRLSIKGAGNHSYNGGEPGDIILTITVKEDDNFVVKGHDLHVNLDVKARDFALGATIPLELPTGKILSIEIEPQTQPTHLVVIDGHGIPGGKKASDGKCYVKLMLDFSEWR